MPVVKIINEQKEKNAQKFTIHQKWIKNLE